MYQALLRQSSLKYYQFYNGYIVKVLGKPRPCGREIHVLVADNHFDAYLFLGREAHRNYRTSDGAFLVCLRTQDGRHNDHKEEGHGTSGRSDNRVAEVADNLSNNQGGNLREPVLGDAPGEAVEENGLGGDEEILAVGNSEDRRGQAQDTTTVFRKDNVLGDVLEIRRGHILLYIPEDIQNTHRIALSVDNGQGTNKDDEVAHRRWEDIQVEVNKNRTEKSAQNAESVRTPPL